MVITDAIGIFRGKRLHMKLFHKCGLLYGRASMEFLLLCLSHYGARKEHWLGGQILALESQDTAVKHHLSQLLT